MLTFKDLEDKQIQHEQIQLEFATKATTIIYNILEVILSFRLTIPKVEI